MKYCLFSSGVVIRFPLEQNVDFDRDTVTISNCEMSFDKHHAAYLKVTDFTFVYSDLVHTWIYTKQIS